MSAVAVPGMSDRGRALVRTFNFLDGRLPGRFWDKAVPEPNSGCWLWIATKHARGYGRFRILGKTVSAHIVSYESLVDTVPIGLELDHLCRNTSCVNPAHLDPVTHTENVRRGEAGTWRSKIDHCDKGHAYLDGSFYLKTGSDGYRRRVCRTCVRDTFVNRSEAQATRSTARMREHRRELIAAGLCAKGASHGKATHGTLCDGCHAKKIAWGRKRGSNG